MKATRVPLSPKLQYEKSYSSIGSTWAARTKTKFIFDFYCSPKLSMAQRLKIKLRGWQHEKH